MKVVLIVVVVAVGAEDDVVVHGFVDVVMLDVNVSHCLEKTCQKSTRKNMHP